MKNVGQVAVDSGQILLVDPCNLPAEIVAALTSPNEWGVTVGTVVEAYGGDGWHQVLVTDDGLTVIDSPWAG